MDIKLRDEFISQWKKYFGKSELPITFFYRNERGDVPAANPGKKWSCLICELGQVRKGESLAWNGKSLMCGGSKR